MGFRLFSRLERLALVRREQRIGGKIAHAAHQQKTRPVRPLRLQKPALDGDGDQHRCADGKAEEKQPQHRHIAQNHAVAHIQAAPQGHHHKQQKIILRLTQRFHDLIDTFGSAAPFPLKRLLE